MMTKKNRITRDEGGAATLEFAMLSPAFLIIFMAVLQVGMAMQNYNALRNVSADVARYAMVQYQTGNKLTNRQIRTYALGHAQGAPYLLKASNMNAAVQLADPQRVPGARELEITITYQADSLLEFAGIGGPYMTYKRPVFLRDD